MSYQRNNRGYVQSYTTLLMIINRDIKFSVKKTGNQAFCIKMIQIVTGTQYRKILLLSFENATQ